MKFPFFILFFLLSFSITTFGQTQAPSLGTAYSFAVFTAAGAFTNTGVTRITGDIGSNTAQLTGDSIILAGAKHFQTTTSEQVATHVKDAYGELGANTCTNTIDTNLGGQILKEGVHCTNAATILNGTLTLDGEGNTGALFIIKIDGAFASSASSTVALINGASLENVFFYVTGQVDLGSDSFFKGTILTGGAINLLQGANLSGRALSTAGAVSLNNNEVTSPPETTLPVVLTSFNAIFKTQGIFLDWTTASEQDNERFEIEYSSNGKEFTKIGEVKGSGTTTVQMKYTFVDMGATTETGYYRLRQVDTKGSYEYSHLISGTQKKSSQPYKVNAYPNPSTGLFTIPASRGRVQRFRVMSMLGLVLEQGVLKDGNLNLLHLSAGTYVLELTGTSGRSMQRLVKQ